MLRRLKILAVLALAGSTCGQSAWSQLSPATSPSPRRGHSLAYDAARDRIVMFGGRDLVAANAETWEFDGSTWIQRQTAFAPSPRFDHATVFVSATGEVLLYGGEAMTAVNTFYDDTWTWDGNSWTPEAPANVPLRRAAHGMAWDPVRQRVVMFGGYDQSGNLPPTLRFFTWEWDPFAANWVLVSPAAFASPSQHFGLSWDPAVGQVVRYGGVQTPNETWTYDAISWYLRSTGPTPSLLGLALVSDTYRDRAVLFGNNATLEWDGADWTSNAATPLAPSARTHHAMAFDSGRQRSVLFGGGSAGSAPNNETWVFEMTNPASSSAFGSACPGPTGTLDLVLSQLPWVGDTFRSSLSNLVPGSLRFSVVGFSNTSFSGGTLPIPLAALHPAAAPGCDLLVDPQAPLLLPGAGTELAFTLAVPNSPSLAGVVLYQQGIELVVDAQLNILAIRGSNALENIVGVR